MKIVVLIYFMSRNGSLLHTAFFIYQVNKFRHVNPLR